jgi:aryl-phospho-beta-D-glucosidase BglC (GH1 family)
MTLLAAACSSNGGTPDLTPPSPAPPVTGHVRTDGTRIVGPNGNSLRLIGVNLQGMDSSNDEGSNVQDACGKAWRVPPDDAAKNIKQWGFNHVRLNLGWANIEPVPPTRNADGTLTHHWGEEFLNALDGVVESLTEERLGIVLTLGQYQWSSAFKESGPSGDQITCEGFGMPAWLNPNAANETIDQARCDFVANRAELGVPIQPWEGLSEVWWMLGDRYGKNQFVIAADVINEPYFVRSGCEGADFQGLFETLGRVVRDVVPSWVLMFEYLPQTNANYHIDSPPPFDNQIYQIHVYRPSWDEVKPILDDSWDQAQQWNMPLYVGEWSAFGATSPQGGVPNWDEETRMMLDYMKERDISWAIFGYAGGLSLIERNGTPRADVIQILQGGI